MNNLKALALASCLGFVAAVAPMAQADQWNKRTILTVNEPIMVPGKVLQPGKYVIRLLDSPSNRHIVQVFNEDESQIQTTVLAIPNYRLQPTGDTVFSFYEAPQGQPKALRAWFYPGDNFGQEFAYPKDASMMLAQYNKVQVPTTYAQTEAELATARVGTVDERGTEMELNRENQQQVAQAPATPAPATPAEQTAAAPATPAPATPAEQPRTEMAQATPAPATPAEQQSIPVGDNTGGNTLPATGSPMPVIGLVGLLSLGAAAAIRRFSNHIS